MEGFRHCRSGSTLLEANLATVLLAGVVLALVGLLPSLILGCQRSGQEVQARALAQSVLEQAREAGFHTLELGSQELAPVESSEARFLIQRTVSALPSEPDANRVRRVTVRVTWEGQRRRHGLSSQLDVVRLAR